MFGIPDGRLALSLWLLGITGIELCAQEVDVGPPRLTEPSFTQIVNPRGVASVAVRVEGEAPFSYNWYNSKEKEGGRENCWRTKGRLVGTSWETTG